MIAIFDFDGVILDSNGPKTRAFEQIARPYGARAAAALVAYHVTHGGVNREVKFRFLFEQILGREPETGELDSMRVTFAAAARAGLAAAREIAGVRVFIQRLTETGHTLAIVSGGVRDEVVDELARRRLSTLFATVIGGDVPKSEGVRRVLGTAGGRAVLFGDSESDYRATVENSIAFVFVYGCSEWSAGLEVLPSAVPRARDFGDHVIDTLDLDCLPMGTASDGTT